MNTSTLLILLGLIIIVGLIIYNLIENKKKGKTSCGSNCAGCALSETCHNKSKIQQGR